MLTNNDNQVQRPWHQEPWLWLVIGLPLAAVVAGLSTVFIAYNHADDLVNDNYYKVGMAINQNLEAEQKALSLGLHGQLFFSGERVQLQLQANNPSEHRMPQKLMLELFHPTLKSKDIKIELSREGIGLFGASYKNNNLIGRRYLRITPLRQSWTLKQEVQIEIGQTLNIDVR